MLLRENGKQSKNPAPTMLPPGIGSTNQRMRWLCYGGRAPVCLAPLIGNWHRHSFPRRRSRSRSGLGWSSRRSRNRPAGALEPRFTHAPALRRRYPSTGCAAEAACVGGPERRGRRRLPGEALAPTRLTYCSPIASGCSVRVATSAYWRPLQPAASASASSPGLVQGRGLLRGGSEQRAGDRRVAHADLAHPVRPGSASGMAGDVADRR
jgi:hypothetical protein